MAGLSSCVNQVFNYAQVAKYKKKKKKKKNLIKTNSSGHARKSIAVKNSMRLLFLLQKNSVD